MDHRLLIARQVTGQPVGACVQRLADTRDIAVAEDRKGAAEERLLDTVDARMLLRQEFHQRLTHGEAPLLGHDVPPYLGPLCGSLRELCTRCESHSDPGRAERA
jgi:hypothetical protein